MTSYQKKDPYCESPLEVRWVLCPPEMKNTWFPRCVDLPSGSRNVMTKGVLIKPGSSPRLQEIWWHPELYGPVKLFATPTLPEFVCSFSLNQMHSNAALIKVYYHAAIICKCATQIIANHANSLNLPKTSVFNTLMEVRTVHPGCVWQLLQSSFHDPLHWSFLQRSKWPQFPWSWRFPALQRERSCLSCQGGVTRQFFEKRWSSVFFPTALSAKYPYFFLQASCGSWANIWDIEMGFHWHCEIPVTCWHTRIPWSRWQRMQVSWSFTKQKHQILRIITYKSLARLQLAIGCPNCKHLTRKSGAFPPPSRHWLWLEGLTNTREADASQGTLHTYSGYQ